MENKKVLNYGDKIEVETMEKVAMMIAKKSLRVMEASGSIYARNIIENHTDEFEDIKQEIMLAIVEGQYIYTKDLYKVARKYIYNNYEKTHIELIFNEEMDNKSLDKKAFLEYVSNTDIERTNRKININDIAQTETQKRILNMFITLQNQKKVAEFLGISRQAVNKTLQKIKDNAEYCKEYLIKA